MSVRSFALVAVTLAACGDPERPTLSDRLIGSCTYVNRFSDGPECRDYLGDWTEDDARADCVKQKSTFVAGEACQPEEVLGYCLIDDDGAQLRVSVLGDDATACGSNKTGCQFFGGGYWDPADVCGGPGADEIVVLDNVFPQPERVCRDPLPGEPAGASEGGQVCTWQMISGSTEEGRRFSDYASCDPVRQQRGYSPVPPNDRYAEPDPRMDDPDYVAEVDWLRGQIRASGCVCCHDSEAPNGPSVFDADAPGNLMNQFNDNGLAMGAGYISTVGFGAFPPEDNNGFARADLSHPNDSIFPTTDMPRMMRLFAAELAWRGRKAEDFAGLDYGAGPLDTLRRFRPGLCSPGEGMDADGTLRWRPGRVRYLYVLEADATTPTVPPNLDLPDGTIWRLDLRDGADPVPSGVVRYGVVPPVMTQRFPADGAAPPALERGKPYYLVASADVVYPISRCLFIAP
ncbi:MAG TPA: hypothetical protein PKA64_03300 [Myxococcota bacterium]|nr:hypothetical protein [Myxococcota bacterium]